MYDKIIIVVSILLIIGSLIYGLKQNLKIETLINSQSFQ